MIAKERTVPPVTVCRWDGCLLPRAEIKASLLYLAHKTGKPVRFGMYPGEPRYSARVVNVFVCTRDSGLADAGIKVVTLDRQDYVLADGQTAYRLELKGSYTLDDNSTTLAVVDRNNVIVRIDFTAADNAAARAILAHVVDQAIPHLRFDVEDEAQSRAGTISTAYQAYFAAALAECIQTKQNEHTQAERDAENYYHLLIGAERQRMATAEELAALQALTKGNAKAQGAKQATQLMALEADAYYEEITLHPNGSVSATTGEIVIEYADWEFPMGQYELLIDPKGRITISATMDHPVDYPHPHVSDTGSPCLGNIHADVGRMIGQFRIAEALQVLYQFLVSYEPSGAYVKIGKFDASGEFDDPDEDPCQDCADKYSPYCIWRCEHNDGWYTCSDCADYRTDYCYRECEHNDDFSPCDDCTDACTERCCLQCDYNEHWELMSPCANCKDGDCAECPWAEKRDELQREEEAAHAQTT